MVTIKLSKSNQEEVIKKTLEVLESGGLVVFPSDTVYGLLADAGNPSAVEKLLKFKERVPGKAISVFVNDGEMASKYVEINQNAKNIIKNLLPGPFTVVCKANNNYNIYNGYKNYIPDPRLLAENKTLGFRIPDYPLILELVKRFGRPVTATSANLSDAPPHYSIGSLLKQLKSLKKLKLLKLIVDAGKLPYNKPSTVVDTTTGQLKTLRFGDLLPKTANSLISKSEKQTKDLARFIVSKMLNKSLGKPIVFLLEGNLGAGKTIFTKGLGKALGVKEEIVSPTFTISYEYKIEQTVGADQCVRPSGFSTENPGLSTDNPIENRYTSDTERLYPNSQLVEQMRNINNVKCTMYNVQLKKLIHYDLYRIETPEDLKEIGFLESIVPGNIYSIEWPEKIDEKTLEELKKKAYVVYIKINHLSPKQREISWSG